MTALVVNQDDAVALAFAHRPIINAKHTRGRICWERALAGERKEQIDATGKADKRADDSTDQQNACYNNIG